MTIVRVLPNKIYYQPDEAAQVQVTITNSPNATVSAQLRVEILHDLDSSITLFDGPISLNPFASNTWTLTWKTLPLLGLEARASISRDGKTVATKSEYFTCARTVHQVFFPLQYNNITGCSATSSVAYAAGLPGWYRANYANVGEQFGWAPSDFDCLTPTVDRWWAGQGGYNSSKPHIMEAYRVTKALGVHPITYGKAAGGGPITFEFLRKHPTYATYSNGRPTIGNYDPAYLDFFEAIGPPKPEETSMVPLSPADMEKKGYKGAAWFTPYTPGLQNWCDVWYDFNNEAVLKHGCDELGKSALMLGFEGVRFDGEFYTSRHQLFDGSWNEPADFDPDQGDKKLVHRMKQIVWSYKPGYLFSYNTHVDFRWNVKSGSAPSAFREKCADDGQIAQEEMAFPGNAPWDEYIQIVRHHSDMVRHYGGHYAVYPFGRNPNYIYCYIIPYALRSHEMFGYQGGEVNINKFCTRFAALLWGDNVHGYDQADRLVGVKASRDLWWKQFAAVRPAPARGTQFIIHLINPPEWKTTLGPKGDLPPRPPAEALPAAPATNVVVRLKDSWSFKRAFVADLDRCDLQEIRPTQEHGEWVFHLPEVKHWSILVIEKNVTTPKQVWALSKEDANLKTPSAQDLQIASPTEPKKDEWHLTLQTEDAYPNPRGVTDLVKELDAKGGASIHSQPGRPSWYMTVGQYCYPYIPGHYIAKYRLKVADNTLTNVIATLRVEHYIGNPMPGLANLTSTNHNLKGTDFKQPNVYQEFEVPFDHPDIGFRGTVCTYDGAGEVWWDQVQVDLVKPWTGEELAKYYSAVQPPKDLKTPPSGNPEVLLVRGLWNRLYRMDEAVAKVPNVASVTNAYSKYHFQQGLNFTGFPLDWDHLFQRNVMVLANLETRTMPLGQERIIQRWVADGGSLVVLGGLLTLGQAGNMDNGWPEMLPVELNGPNEIVECIPPVKFASPDASLGLKSPPWDVAPVVMFRHKLKPKAGATVLLAGDHGEPLLVGGTFGKGRVVVFAGTVLGEPPGGQIAFWKSSSWPDVLAAAIRWSRNQ